MLLPWSGVLARAEEVAVLLTAAHLYTNGIQFELSVRGRGRGVYDLHAPAGGFRTRTVTPPKPNLPAGGWFEAYATRPF